MPGKSGFDFYGASRSFNTLAEYLFGKVVEGTYRVNLRLPRTTL